MTTYPQRPPFVPQRPQVPYEVPRPIMPTPERPNPWRR